MKLIYQTNDLITNATEKFNLIDQIKSNNFTDNNTGNSTRTFNGTLEIEHVKANCTAERSDGTGTSGAAINSTNTHTNTACDNTDEGIYLLQAWVLLFHFSNRWMAYFIKKIPSKPGESRKAQWILQINGFDWVIITLLESFSTSNDLGWKSGMNFFIFNW